MAIRQNKRNRISINSSNIYICLFCRNYAFLVEQSYYDTLGSKDNMSFANESCSFARAEEPFFMSMYAFPFQKNSPYIKQFSIA